MNDARGKFNWRYANIQRSRTRKKLFDCPPQSGQSGRVPSHLHSGRFANDSLFEQMVN